MARASASPTRASPASTAPTTRSVGADLLEQASDADGRFRRRELLNHAVPRINRRRDRRRRGRRIALAVAALEVIARAEPDAAARATPIPSPRPTRLLTSACAFTLSAVAARHPRPSVPSAPPSRAPMLMPVSATADAPPSAPTLTTGRPLQQRSRPLSGAALPSPSPSTAVPTTAAIAAPSTSEPTSEPSTAAPSRVPTTARRPPAAARLRAAAWKPPLWSFILLAVLAGAALMGPGAWFALNKYEARLTDRIRRDVESKMLSPPERPPRAAPRAATTTTTMTPCGTCRCRSRRPRRCGHRYSTRTAARRDRRTTTTIARRPPRRIRPGPAAVLL